MWAWYIYKYIYIYIESYRDGDRGRITVHLIKQCVFLFFFLLLLSGKLSQFPRPILQLIFWILLPELPTRLQLLPQSPQKVSTIDNIDKIAIIFASLATPEACHAQDI